MTRAFPPPRPRRIRPDPERVDMATLIPDDRTLAIMSALATLADRGEADLDFATLEAVRARLPALRHRRPEVYGGETRS